MPVQFALPMDVGRVISRKPQMAGDERAAINAENRTKRV
jgi:hypothetical protein